MYVSLIYDRHSVSEDLINTADEALELDYYTFWSRFMQDAQRAYAIHHDKVIIADRQTVEQGSFNYSDAAAHRNSENVLVNWGNPKLRTSEASAQCEAAYPEVGVAQCDCYMHTADFGSPTCRAISRTNCALTTTTSGRLRALDGRSPWPTDILP